MQPMLILALVFLLVVSNGTPIVANWILGERFATPLDGGIGFVDGRPLFGRAKTIRGILLSVVAAAAVAPMAAPLITQPPRPPTAPRSTTTSATPTTVTRC